MRRSIIAAPLLAAALVGCAQTFDATQLGVPVTMAGAAGDSVVGTHFKVSTHSVHGFWGLVTIAPPNLQKALATQLVGAQQLAQVKIKTKTRWLDLLITGLTAGLIVPRTVTYEGVVVGR